MEIAPSVHAVRLFTTQAYLITEQELTLIDAGLPGSRRGLERYLKRIGRNLGELKRIICTHAHPDHIGGVRELAAGADVEVLMHPADIAGLKVTLREAWTDRDRSKLIAWFTRGPHAATPIDDGEVLPVLGGLRVVHTPGHTPGSICLYAPLYRLLFTGDMLQVIRGRMTFASAIFSADLAQAQASVARLAALDVETIAFGHYPPWRRDCNGSLASLAAEAGALPGMEALSSPPQQARD